MSDPKIQHYVPQLLLRRFATKKKATWQLHVFDKSTGKNFRSNVDRAAAESGFNDFDIELEGQYRSMSAEPMFTAIETKFGPVLEKLLKSRKLRSLSDEERARIAHYMAVQKQRVPSSRLDGAELVRVLVQELRDRGGDDARIESMLGPIPDENQLKRESLQQIRDPEFISAVADGFVKDKVWVLLQNDTKAPFIIGDNPVVLQNVSSSVPKLGIESQGIEIFLPLSPTLTLAVICKSIFHGFLRTRNHSPAAQLYLGAVEQDVPVVFSTGQATEFLNRLNFLQIGYSERFLFSNDGEFGLVREVLERCPEMKTGPRPKAVRFDTPSASANKTSWPS